MPTTKKRWSLEHIALPAVIAAVVCSQHGNAIKLLQSVGTLAGCTEMPAFRAHVEVGVADSTENLPTAGRQATGSTRARTSTVTTAPSTPPQP